MHIPDKEAHTPSLLMWNEALLYVEAANELTPSDDALRFRTPTLQLASHGIEVAMKSFLRAKGCLLDDLIRLRHYLIRTLDACTAQGMEPPSEEDWHYLNFLSEAHAGQEFRYVHLDRPSHMHRTEWMRLAEWALRCAIPAVAETEKDPAGASQQMLRRLAKVFASEHTRLDSPTTA